MIITAKVVAICLGLALTAFTVSTIVLAVQKANLTDELNDALKKLDDLSTTTTTITTTTSASTTTTSTTAAGTTPTTTVSTTTGVPETTTTAPEVIKYRLPDSIYPINYDLYLHPDIDTGNFTGQMVIRVNTTSAINQIVLHSNNLSINNVYLKNTNSQTVYVKNFYFDAVREFLVVELSEELPAARAFDIGILFEGNMSGKIVGLYSSSYTKEDSSKKVIATSKFEPTYARQAFPCFDEPAMKATFEITLVYPKGGDYHALSNMDILQESDQGNYVEVYFNKSVPMSTYLACFIVSDFTSKSVEIDTNGIGSPFTLRAFATPEQIEKVNFALEVGKGVLEYYIQYFQIEYPLPKMDMAAIPDFVSGAMEHWGLVTYRETALLYDEAESSTANKQSVALVIAHEFAHMWFGNLVTMEWWNDLWLNEGFARYIENKGLNAVYPEWKMLDQFISYRLHAVLTLDATLGSHPIIQTVESPAEITEIFDTITYGKGGSLIRMLEDFIGADNFQTAVTNYLNKFKYKNAVTDDLLTEIENLNLGIDVKSIMNTWTVQMGFPVVTVEQVTMNTYRLTQKRFFSNPDDYDTVYEDSPYNYTWSIPITFKTNVTADVQRAWFLYDQEELIIELDSPAKWIMFNYDQIGLYRVSYTDELRKNLVDELIADPQTFTVGDRAGLLNDAFSLADATQLSYDTALDMTSYLTKEQDYVPWSVAATKLTTLKRALMFTDTYVNYKQYALALIEPIYKVVTWDVGTDHLENRLRQTILSSACSLGLESCLQNAAALLKAYLAEPTTRPHPDIRETVYYHGMSAIGNETTWQAMWSLFIAESDANEKSKLMYGLAAVQVPWILSNYVNLAWSEDNVRSQDYFTCLQYIASNPVGESIVWDYVREQWPKLVERFGINERTLGNLIPAITANFDKQTKLEEMERLFAKYPEAGAGAAARVRALEAVKNNIVWLANNKNKIGAWLENYLV
ncbi:glutamyl aminopeptidase-like [Anastrepha ludens]|uniref:glutamyl aminopeptidase-like n=1 Tax=Anastrepha ludens TaxID=28586 RepID=UPI0023AF1CBA|nr:glutamyl aminopeptidase-like [Anastrepha ludens]